MQKLVIFGIFLLLLSGNGISQSWAPVGSGPVWVYALTFYNGDLIVGGVFGVLKWNGGNWVTIDGGSSPGFDGQVNALEVYGGNLYAGGAFTWAGDVPAKYIAKWDGAQWSEPQGGTDNWVTCLTVYQNALIVGGYFTTAHVPANYIAKWDGSNWSALGSGLWGGDGYNGEPMALTVYGADLIAGGYFDFAGGNNAHRIAKWNGTSWSSLGTGIDSVVFALTAYSGKLIAGGLFSSAGGVTAYDIASWNGSAWSAMGSGMSGGLYPYITSLATLGSDLYAGGLYKIAGGLTTNGIAKWNGSEWSGLGTGFGNYPYLCGAFALCINQGYLIAGGCFNSAGGIPVLDVAQWTPPPVTITSVATGGTWNALATWDLDHVPNSTNNLVVINSSPTPVTVSTTTSWPGNVTINSGKYLTANTSLSIGGTFDIESGGSFIDNNSNILPATVKRTMTGNWSGGLPIASTIFHMVSAPVSNATINVFLNSLMNKWTEPAQSWDSLVLPTTLPMNVGAGYSVAARSAITSTYTGSLNTGNTTVNGLTKTGTLNYAGYNLVGNPFPSAIVWNTSNTVSNLDNFSWLWNGGNYIAKDRTIGDGIIPAEQGFFVRVTSAGNGLLTISNAARIHSALGYFKSYVPDLITMRVEGNGYWDETQIRFLSEASEGYQPETDALKMEGCEIAPQLYSIAQGQKLSINSMPDVTLHPVIQVGFKAGASGTFVLTVSGFESFIPCTEFYLEDIPENKVQNLISDSVYIFTAGPGQAEHRFNLHFAPIDVWRNGESNMRVYAYDKVIYVSNPASIQGTIIVYDILGIEVCRVPLNGISMQKVNLDMNTGYFIVKVIGEDLSFSTKVFIR